MRLICCITIFPSFLYFERECVVDVRYFTLKAKSNAKQFTLSPSSTLGVRESIHH
jgi:hypothetical protein